MFFIAVYKVKICFNDKSFDVESWYLLSMRPMPYGGVLCGTILRKSVFKVG